MKSPSNFSPLAPVFVVQWLFDEAQLTVDNVHLTGQPVQEGQWLYIQNLGRELRNTLKDVTLVLTLIVSAPFKVSS